MNGTHSYWPLDSRVSESSVSIRKVAVVETLCIYPDPLKVFLALARFPVTAKGE